MTTIPIDQRLGGLGGPGPARAAPVAPERLGPATALRHTLAITGRNLKHMACVPIALFFVAFQPVMLVLLFNYVFGGAVRGVGVRYIEYLVPGVLVQVLTFTSSFSGMGFAQDLTSGALDRFRSLPVARSAMVTGRVLADTLRMAFSAVVVVAVGSLIGFRFHAGVVPAVGAVLLAVAFGWAMSWIGLAVGLAARDPEAVQASSFVWSFPLVFASSSYVTAATMPGWLQAFVKANPVSVVADAIRALILGGATATRLLEALAWIAAIALLFSTLTVRQYRRLR
jgi:ABC transporter DrrB family efflux protein